MGKKLKRNIHGDESRAVCNSPFERILRNTIGGFRRYAAARPIYFEITYGTKYCPKAVDAVWKMLRGNGEVCGMVPSKPKPKKEKICES